jgi:hypothetical protein
LKEDMIFLFEFQVFLLMFSFGVSPW